MGDSSAEDFTKQLTETIESLTGEIKKLKAQMEFTSKPCYTNTEAQDIFGVTRATLKKWRDEGLLGYSQIGSIYQYSQKDIQDFLHNTHCRAYSFE